MNNGLRMDQKEFESAFASFDKLFGELSEKAQGIQSSFAPAVSSGLMKNLGQLQNQLSSIGTSISSVNATMKKNANEMFEYDAALAKEADALEIPTDFLKENSQQVNNYNKVIMDKLDGKSVNAGTEQGPVSIEDAIKINTQTREGLKDQSGNTSKEEVYSEKRGRSQDLGNISKDSDVSEKEYAAKNGIRENIDDISKNANLDQKQVNDANIRRSEIGNISKNSNTQTTDIESAINFRGQSFNQFSSSKSFGVSSNAISQEDQEKNNILSSMILNEEAKKEMQKEKEELEKVDYNDFNK